MTMQLAVPRTYPHILAIAKHPRVVDSTHELRFADSPDPDLRRITDPSCARVTASGLRRGVGQ